MIMGVMVPEFKIPQAVSEDDIRAQQPAVRGQLLARLESLYQTCLGQLEDVDGPDPRWAELAVRITDRQSKLMRLDPQAAPEGGDDGAAAVEGPAMRAIASGQLDALEAKLRDGGE